MTRVNKTVLVLVALVALVLGLTVHKVLTAQRQADPTVLLDAGIEILPQTRKVPALEFTNQDGQAVSTASLKGRWHLLLFGYTFCPDVCPTTLAQLRELQGKLPQEVRDDLYLAVATVLAFVFQLDEAGFASAVGDGTVPPGREDAAELAADNCPELAVLIDE